MLNSCLIFFVYLSVTKKLSLFFLILHRFPIHQRWALIRLPRFFIIFIVTWVCYIIFIFNGDKYLWCNFFIFINKNYLSYIFYLFIIQILISNFVYLSNTNLLFWLILIFLLKIRIKLARYAFIDHNLLNIKNKNYNLQEKKN
jgi:hypothetical protein